MTGISAIYTHPPRTRLAVSVGRGGEFEQLASVRVLERASESWDWTPLEVDVSAYGGERVTLRLESRPDTPLEPGALVGWRSPRVVLAR